MPVTRAITLQDITDYPVVEAQAVLDVMEFFPTLTKTLLEEGSFLAAADAHRSGQRPAGSLRAELRRKDPAPNILINSSRDHQPRPARAVLEHHDSDRFEKGLAAAGLAVDSIDYVMCTHLHVSHVAGHSGSENGAGVPTFPGPIRHGRPRARVLDTEGEG